MVVKKPQGRVERARPAKKTTVSGDKKGVSLDDAFGDDEDVEYAPSKPAKIKKEGVSVEELEGELNAIESENGMRSDEPSGPVTITASKPIAALKKSDRVNIDGIACIVDAHYVLIDHGSTKEMALELYDANDHDYQLRYFNDQVETTLELYELKEIIYIKKPMTEVSW